MNKDNELEENDQWESFGDNKQIKYLLDGKIIVIAPKALKQIIVPLFCPLCNLPMKTKEDGVSYRNLNCCEQCELHFGTAIKIEKKSIDEIKIGSKWREYIVDRLNRSRKLLKLK